MSAMIASPAFALTDTYIDALGVDQLGYVSAGGSIEYDHFFAPINDPSIEISSIDTAWLAVGVIDDSVCRSLTACMKDWFFVGETALIQLNSVAWESGSATAAIFFGDVTADANLLANDGVLHVTVSSMAGDFVVLWSSLSTNYTYELASGGGGAGQNHIPEPSAALVFAIGALLIGRSTRLGRRGSSGRS
jgi:hypothetical protein